jgi:hypothetical protein
VSVSVGVGEGKGQWQGRTMGGCKGSPHLGGRREGCGDAQARGRAVGNATLEGAYNGLQDNVGGLNTGET